jgi:hypothetical protein
MGSAVAKSKPAGYLNSPDDSIRTATPLYLVN